MFLKKLLKYKFVLASLVMSLALAFPYQKASVYRGEVKTKIFHHSACEDYNGHYEKVEFSSQKEAMDAKYRQCNKCFTKIDGKWIKVSPHSKKSNLSQFFEKMWQ